MKKLFLLFTAVTLTCISCTEQQRARRYGGNATIEVDPGYKLLEVTWKDDGDLWMFMEEMDSDYVPKTKIFKEESSFGIMEGCITFKESR